jgi:NAD(P)-dependent dehydrogenase (short-subunit alcohol dehydrogenase family)
VQNEIRDLGADALSVPTDVTSIPAVNALVEAAMNRFGRIDVLVNNAGIGKVGGVESATFDEDVRQTLQASLFGMIHVTQCVLPILRRQRSGTIVNMSSVMGRKAFARFGSYAIVMHAVSAFSDALRQELAGSNIRVSVIHPALTATDLLRDADEAEIVLPRTASMLLFGEALSPRIGDAIATALTRRPLARLLRMSRGVTYHETILSRDGSNQRDVAPASSLEKAGSSVRDIG